MIIIETSFNERSDKDKFKVLDFLSIRNVGIRMNKYIHIIRDIRHTTYAVLISPDCEGVSSRYIVMCLRRYQCRRCCVEYNYVSLTSYVVVVSLMSANVHILLRNMKKYIHTKPLMFKKDPSSSYLIFNNKNNTKAGIPRKGNIAALPAGQGVSTLLAPWQPRGFGPFILSMNLSVCLPRPLAAF